LQWVPVEAGVFRLNRVKDASSVAVDCSARDERDLPGTFVNYDENPREYLFCAVTTVVEIHTRVSDLYSVPHNQIAQQLRLAIEAIKASLNEDGIAVRAGHHCAQPILRRFGVETSVRPSLALYNTFAEIDALAAAVRRIQAKHAPYRGTVAG
jgi:cysteine sulfinate desulfinase/cysteine desulfurase-like protein